MGEPHKEEHAGRDDRKKDFAIVVNARHKTVDKKTLTFDDVVRLAFPDPASGQDVLFTVVFHHADQKPADGTLVAGQTVEVRDGTSFDVTKTNRS